MPKTRITLEIDSELLERIEAHHNAELRIQCILAQAADFDFRGAPLFLDDDQHRRLRELSGSAGVGGAEALLARLAELSSLAIDGYGQLQLPPKIQERLATRAKTEGKPVLQVATDYALAGIRERVGL